MVSGEQNKYSDATPSNTETIANVYKHFKTSGKVDKLPRRSRLAIALTEDKLQIVKETVKTNS